MYRYVVIDDEPLSRKGIIKKLEPLSEDVVCCSEAENGQDGIASIEKYSPDFVILDMQMPVMGGMELLPWLSQHYPSLPLIVVSGYSNFEYMKQAISSKVVNYILKPFSRNEIQETVLSIISMFQKQENMQQEISFARQEQKMAWYQMDLMLLENFIWGCEVDSLTMNSEELNFLNVGSYEYFLFTLYFLEHSGETLKNNIINIQPTMDRWIYFPSGSRQHFGFALWVTNDASEKNRSSIENFANQFICRDGLTQSTVRVAVSSVHSDLTELHTALLETQSALDGQPVVTNGEKLLFQNNCPLTVINWQQESEFLFRLESGEWERAQTLLERLFALYLNAKDCTLADVKRHIESICMQCRTLLNAYVKSGVDDESTWILNAHTALNNLFSFEDVHEYCQKMFLSTSQIMCERGIYQTGTLIDKVQLYMRHNYKNPITQELIASLFYVNRSYLSTLFKEKTGQKFVDYLNELRIEKAKDLLKKTDKQVFRIARTVGYDNTKYFFRIFKSKTGMSPEEYRLSESIKK